MQPIFTPAELLEVHAYARPFYVWIAVRDLVTLGVFAALLGLGVRPLYAAALRGARAATERSRWVVTVPVVRVVPAALTRMWSGPGWGTALLFSLLYVLFLAAVYLPKDAYFGYFHPLRFGLSNHTPYSFISDSLKALVLQVLATAFLAFGLFGLARRLRQWWWVLGIAAGLALLFSSVLDPFRSRLYNTQRPLASGPLRDQITDLMAKANIEFANVVVEETSRTGTTVNAYFAGQGPTRTIVLTDTLVEKLAPDEVLAAVAHEAGHIHEPRWLRRALASLALLGFLFAVHRIFLAAARRNWWGVTDYADIRTLPLIGFLLWGVLSVAQPVSASDARARELEADRFAVALTKDPEAFRRMLVSATRINKYDPDPPRWIEVRAYTHPSVRTRLEHLGSYEKNASSR